MSRTILIDGHGRVSALTPACFESPVRCYRLYRFLAEAAALGDDLENEQELLAALAPRLEQTLQDNPEIAEQYLIPEPDTGWSVLPLHRRPLFGIDVKMVSWAPRRHTPVHGHDGWALVKIMVGSETHRIFRRRDREPSEVECVAEYTFAAGDTIMFTRDAIHQVRSGDCELTVSLNLYAQESQAWGRYRGASEWCPKPDAACPPGL